MLEVGVDMRSNIIKMDSKGRISVPFSLRNLFGINCGDKLILETNEKEITATPVLKTGNTKINIVFQTYK